MWEYRFRVCPAGFWSCSICCCSSLLKWKRLPCATACWRCLTGAHSYEFALNLREGFGVGVFRTLKLRTLVTLGDGAQCILHKEAYGSPSGSTGRTLWFLSKNSKNWIWGLIAHTQPGGEAGPVGVAGRLYLLPGPALQRPYFLSTVRCAAVLSMLSCFGVRHLWAKT